MNQKIQDLSTIIKTSNQVDKNFQVTNLTQDISTTLDERWALYVLAVDSNYLVSNDPYYFEPDTLTDLSLTDDMYIEKYQSYTYKDFLDYFNGNGIGESIINSVKEEILQTGKSSWTNDW